MFKLSEIFLSKLADHLYFRVGIEWEMCIKTHLRIFYETIKSIQLLPEENCLLPHPFDTHQLRNTSYIHKKPNASANRAYNPFFLLHQLNSILLARILDSYVNCRDELNGSFETAPFEVEAGRIDVHLKYIRAHSFISEAPKS